MVDLEKAGSIQDLAQQILFHQEKINTLIDKIFDLMEVETISGDLIDFHGLAVNFPISVRAYNALRLNTQRILTKEKIMSMNMEAIIQWDGVGYKTAQEIFEIVEIIKNKIINTPQ